MNSIKKLAMCGLGLAASLIPALALVTNTPVPTAELKPGPDDGSIAMVVGRMLEQGHYTQHPFNDEMSGKMLDRYLNTLDPQHIHFLQTDLEKFELYRDRLDNLTLQRGDTWPAYEIFIVFRERLAQRSAYADELLKTEKFDFTKDERIRLNRKDEPAPKNMTEARQLWLERLRFEYLQEKLAESDDGKTLKSEKSEKSASSTNGAPGKVKPEKTLAGKIAETLSKRYHRQLSFFEQMDRDDVFELYLTSLARSYDPHTDYMGKPSLEQFAISMNLALFGIGAQLRMDDDGYCNIDHLMPKGPAERSGLVNEKDRIVAVAQSNAAPVDVVGMNLTKTVQMIRGPKGSEVRLTLESPETSERRVVSLIRDEIPIEDQQAKAKLVDLPGPNKSNHRVGVINLPSFYSSMETSASNGKSVPRHASDDVALLIKKLKEEHVEGIVLDLRNNGGGSLEEAVKLAGLFIKEGPVVQVKEPEGKPIVDADEDPAVLWDGPLVVLTGRFSASASEIVAAALQDYGRALVVGESTTHGKGTVQSLNQLKPYLRMAGIRTTNEPGALKFTIRKFYRANGASTQFEGVTPDIVLPSVLNHSKELGEASLENALRGDTITSAKFDKLDRVTPYLPELHKLSDQRVAKSRDFTYIREDIDQYLKRESDKSISLNEKERRAESAEEEARKQARNKERASRKGPKPVVYEISLKQAGVTGLPEPVTTTNSVAKTKAHSSVGSVAATNSRKTDEEEAAPDVDPMLDETEAILVDYSHLLGKMITAKN
jgi:carboxyl-terminal processing protease